MRDSRAHRAPPWSRRSIAAHLRPAASSSAAAPSRPAHHRHEPGPQQRRRVSRRTRHCGLPWATAIPATPTTTARTPRMSRAAEHGGMRRSRRTTTTATTATVTTTTTAPPPRQTVLLRIWSPVPRPATHRPGHPVRGAFSAGRRRRRRAVTHGPRQPRRPTRRRASSHAQATPRFGWQRRTMSDARRRTSRLPTCPSAVAPQLRPPTVPLVRPFAGCPPRSAPTPPPPPHCGPWRRC